MKCAHEPCSVREERVTLPRTPGIERGTVFAAELAKAVDGALAFSNSTTPYCKCWVQRANGLPGMRAPEWGKLCTPLSSEECPSFFLNVDSCFCREPLDFAADEFTEALGGLKSGGSGWQSDLELDLIWPKFVFGVEEKRGPLDTPHGIAEFVDSNLDSRPILSLPHKAGSDGVGDSIRDFLNHSVGCQQFDDRCFLVIPNRTFPFTQSFGAKACEAMEEL